MVAETFEQARAAAQLVRVKYVRADGAFDLAKAKDTAIKPEKITARPAGFRSWRFRRRVRDGARQAGCHLHDA